MKYIEFLNLTDEEIKFILTEIFHSVKDAILPLEGKVRFTCDNKECHLKLIGWID